MEGLTAVIELATIRPSTVRPFATVMRRYSVDMAGVPTVLVRPLPFGERLGLDRPSLSTTSFTTRLPPPRREPVMKRLPVEIATVVAACNKP